ncbi:MAG: hypothetical protein ACPIOQ_21915, partial [Promethearchaeia archaeon]
PNRQAAKPATAHSASVGERSCIDSSGCATVDSSQQVLETLRCLKDSQRGVERKVDKAVDRLEQACARLDRVCRHLNLSEDSELSDSTGRIAGSNGSDASKPGLGLRSHAVTSRKERARAANDVVGASFVAVQKGNAASKDSVHSVEVGEKGVSDEARHLKDACCKLFVGAAQRATSIRITSKTAGTHTHTVIDAPPPEACQCVQIFVC